MTTAYTSLLGLALPVTGELSGTWGDTVNTAITSLLDTAIAGTTSITTDADITLSTTTGASNQARQAIILWNPASGTTTRNITAPAQSKMYVVINASGGTQSIVIRGAGPTTGVTIAKGESATVAWNGSDFVKVGSSGGAITFTDLTVTGNTILGDAAADTLTVNATSTFNAPVSFAGLVRLPSTGRSAAAALTTTNPAFLYGVASTYTDTTSSGTVAFAPFYGLAQPTLSTSNVTTYTNAATLYIANAPAAGGSATITNPYALYVASGANYLGGALAVAGATNLNGAVTLGDAAADNITVTGTVTSNLIFTDNTYDIGASGATRPRTLYLGTSVITPLIDATNVEATNIKALDGTAAMTIANSTGVVSFTANPVLSGGTANGIVYLDGSKVATTGSVLAFDGSTVIQTKAAAVNNRYYDLVDTSASGVTWGLLNRIGNVAGNFGIFNVTGSIAAITANTVGNIGTANFVPSSWASGWNSVQLGGTLGVFGGTGQGVALNSNAYWDGTNYKYIAGASTPAGQLDFSIAESGGWAWRIATSGTSGNNITWTVPMKLTSGGQLMVGAGPNNAQSYDLGVYRAGTDVRLLINSDNGYNAYMNIAGFSGGWSTGRDGGTGHLRWNNALNLGGTQVMTLETSGNLYLGATGGLGAATVSGLYVQSGSYVPGGQVTQLLGYWMSSANDDNGQGGAGIRLYRVPRGGGVQTGTEVRFYTGYSFSASTTAEAGKFDQNQNFIVNGSYISLVTSIGYNSSVDRNIYIGATNDDSVNNGATYQWRWNVLGDATGQLIRLNYYARNVGEVEAFRIGNNGILFYGGTQNPNNATKGTFNGLSTSGGQGVFCFNNIDTTTSSDAGPAVVFYKGSSTTSSSQRFLQFYCGAGPMGGIVGNGAENVQFLTLSDEREKTNIQPLTGALGRIMQIQVSSFDRRGSNEHVKAGFVAQNVLPIYPEYVVENAANEGDEQRYGITGGMSAGFIAELTAALQELTNEFNAYKASHP